MKARKRFTCVVVLCSCLKVLVFAQGETAASFLLITSSPEGNGIGGISASVLTDNATAMIANPGQLGIQSLNSYFRTSFYAPNTAWLPAFQLNELTYSTTAFNLGLNLSKFASFPFPLSFGVGYSRIFLNLGTFSITGPDPTPIATFEGYEKSESFSFAIGFNYFVQGGIGLNLKNIDSHILPPDSIMSSSDQSAFATARDFGITLNIPITDIISGFRSEPWIMFDHAEPLFNLTLAYVHSNDGGEIQYLPFFGPDPLPRKATLGGSIEFGVISTAVSEKWRIASVTVAHEAHDILVKRFPPVYDSTGTLIVHQPEFEYQAGTGDIRVFDNVILGNSNDKVWLHKGWQINLGEIFYLRGGSVDAPGLRYFTSGFSFRLRGIFNLIETVNESGPSSPLLNFVVNHVDLQFDHSSESSDGPRNGTTYNGFTFMLK